MAAVYGDIEISIECDGEANHRSLLSQVRENMER